jgi:hypothetical protein
MIRARMRAGTRHLCALFAGFLVAGASGGTLSAADAGTPEPLPCEQAPRGDPQPWVHRARVLSSFAADDPAPRFVGAFAGHGKRGELELHLWRDARGIFGVLLSPVLDVDSPSGRLRDVQFDEKLGRFAFTARYEGMAFTFAGRLRRGTISGTFTGTYRNGTFPDEVTLRKLGTDEGHGAPSDQSYTSRAQFECAMTLIGR